MKDNLICHVVAGYPSEKDCVELLLGMQKAGVETIEVQIPFSDPIADGETIMIANDKALETGMTTQKSFDLLKTAKRSGLKVDIYIMSYAQKLLNFGVENFCKQAESTGVKGLIIPDLPFDSGEFKDLNKQAEKHNLVIVPVVSPGMDKKRLLKAIEPADDLIYLTSIKGITGNKLNLGKNLEFVAKEIKRRKPDSSLAIGFGIGSKKDVQEVLRIADMAVLGSSIIRKINKSGTESAVDFIKTLTI